MVGSSHPKTRREIEGRRGPQRPRYPQARTGVVRGRTRNELLNMALLKSKGLWVTVGLTIGVLILVNRVSFLRNLVYGAPATTSN